MHDPAAQNVGTGVDNDPLAGACAQGNVPKTKGPIATASSTAPVGVGTAALPAAPHPTASAAALAAGVAQPGDKDIDPRLAPDPHAPANSVTPVGGAGVALQGPTAHGVDTADPRDLVASPVSQKSLPVENLQRGLDLIKSYGAVDRCLEEVSDGVWKFSCRMPIPSTGEIPRAKVVEATLPGEDGLIAVRAVLQKIQQIATDPPAPSR